MLTHQPQLPTLSPENHQLLLRYFAANENPAALISPTFDLIDIYQWLLSPEIAPFVALHREHADRTLRTQVKVALRTLLDHPTNPIETRRIATTLLRALQPPRPIRHHQTAAPSTPRPQPEPSGASRGTPTSSPGRPSTETPCSSPRPSRLCEKSSPPQMENARRNASGATPVLSHNPHSPARAILTAAGRAVQPSRTNALGPNST